MAIARAGTAETLQLGPSSLRLLLDDDATGGAISAHRVHLTDGGLGANPHVHAHTSEVFYVVDGSLDLLVGEELESVTAGDLVVVPPGHAHAFAASPGCDAEVFLFITPGIQRFEFFRQLLSVAARDGTPDGLLKSQANVDTYPVKNHTWRTPR